MSTPLIRTLRISPSMSTSSSHAPRSVAPVKYTLRNHARLKSTCSNRAPDRSCFTNSAMRTACHPVPTSGSAPYNPPAKMPGDGALTGAAAAGRRPAGRTGRGPDAGAEPVSYCRVVNAARLAAVSETSSSRNLGRPVRRGQVRGLRALWDSFECCWPPWLLYFVAVLRRAWALAHDGPHSGASTGLSVVPIMRVRVAPLDCEPGRLDRGDERAGHGAVRLCRLGPHWVGTLGGHFAPR
jgi:hypothetical protein